MRTKEARHAREQQSGRMRRFQKWVNRVQIKLAAYECFTCKRKAMKEDEDEIIMLDKGSGSGGSICYAFDAGVTLLFQIDVAKKRIDEAREEFARLKQRVAKHAQTRQIDPNFHDMRQVYQAHATAAQPPSMTCVFAAADAFSAQTNAYLLNHLRASNLQLDIVTYFNSLHYATTSVQRLEQEFLFCSHVLSTHGTIIIKTIDSDVLEQFLFCAAFDAGLDTDGSSLDDIVVSNALFSLVWPARQPLTSPLVTGQPYTFSFKDSFANAEEYVLNRTDIEVTAGKCGFYIADSFNLSTQYAALQSPATSFLKHASHLLPRLYNQIPAFMTADEYQTLSLYRCFVLKRAPEL